MCLRSVHHQSLHYFVAKAQWSDQELLRRVAQWVVPQMDFSTGGWWIIDDTGFPKKGRHSVGVTRQYCGVLGEQGSLPVAWQLYLPHNWVKAWPWPNALIPFDKIIATLPTAVPRIE